MHIYLSTRNSNGGSKIRDIDRVGKSTLNNDYNLIKSGCS